MLIKFMALDKPCFFIVRFQMQRFFDYIYLFKQVLALLCRSCNVLIALTQHTYFS